MVYNTHHPFRAQVTWFKSTMQQDITERHSIVRHGTRYSLIIRNVQRSDFDNYTCTAENTLGKVRRFVALTGKPNVAVVRSKAVSVYRDRYNLTWTVQSAAPILETRIAYRKVHDDGLHGGLHDTDVIENDLMAMQHNNMFKPNVGGIYWPLKNDWLDVILPNERQANEVEQRLSYMIRDLEAGKTYEANITSK